MYRCKELYSLDTIYHLSFLDTLYYRYLWTTITAKIAIPSSFIYTLRVKDLYEQCERHNRLFRQGNRGIARDTLPGIYI